MSLKQTSIDKLNQLVRFEIENCDLTEFDFDLFLFVLNLQVLYVNNSLGNMRIDLKNLVNLKCIILERLDDLEALSNIKSPNLFFARLYDCKIDNQKADSILNESWLPQLHALHLSNNSLTKLDLSWFKSLSNLVELNL